MKFADVPHLATLKQKLANSVDQDRLPHAMLLSGPEGSGKLPLAMALTQYLYCTDKQDGDSCGVCSSCGKITQMIHPDVHFTFPFAHSKAVCTDFIAPFRREILENPYLSVTDWITEIAETENKAPNIYVSEIRNIKSKLALKAYEGEAKTLIIWLPEYLGQESNILLKLIEEPPQKTYFILVTEKPENLLATITSRTQLVKIPGYTPLEAASFVKEKYGLDATRAEQLGFLSDGNLRVAVQNIESVENNYNQIFRDWMANCFTNNLSKVSEITEQQLHKLGRVQIQVFLTNGLKILRECLMYSMVDNYKINAEESQQEFIRKFSKVQSAAHIQKSYDQINEAIYHVKRNSNSKITLFHLSLNLRYNFIRKGK